jgi:hypothetical protein
MADNIARLNIFNQTEYRERLVLIDLKHDAAPPLNLFHPVGSTAAVNYAINNFDYLFAQGGVELTPRMRPIFRHCARLMFFIPKADIFLFMDLLESKPNDPFFKPYIDAIADDGAQRFFAKDFYGEGYKKTRESVKERFDQILSLDPRLRAAFSSPSPPLDMGKCLAERKIVLVNTGFADVGPDESKYLGRHIINLTFGAAFARGRNGNPAFLFIDEFQDFVDEERTAKQLRLAREYNLGIVCAHQNMFCPELSDDLRTAISTNTTIKYCSAPGGRDKTYMAGDFGGVDQEYLAKHVKSATHANFACLVKGYPPFSVQVPFGNISKAMQMSDTDHQRLLLYNRSRLHPPQTKIVAPATPSPPALAPPVISESPPPTITKVPPPTLLDDNAQKPSEEWSDNW